MAYFFLYGFDISKPSERPTGRDREAYPDFEPVCTVDMKVGVGTGEGPTAKETQILKLALGDEPLHVDADELRAVLQTQGALRKPGVRIELPTKSVGYWKERTPEQVAEGGLSTRRVQRLRWKAPFSAVASFCLPSLACSTAATWK